MEDRFRFRAWIPSRELMINPDSIHWNGQKVCYGARNFFTEWFDNYQEVEEHNRGIIMQCTGLKDKNGKLIYEGDVLCVHPYNDSENLRFVVKFGLGTWDSGFYKYQGFYLENPKGYSDSNGAYIFDERIEIIGNIWENPELLEKK